jgi:hypothetical protein
MRARHFFVAALTCVLIVVPRPDAVLAQGISSSATTEEIKYRDLTFKLPRLGWERAETACCLTLTRTVSPDRLQTLFVVAVEIPRELQTRTIGQHSSAYFEMQRTQQRAPDDHWQGFSERVQKVESREFAAMTFTVTKNATQSPPSVHGLSVLHFPSDFVQRQGFYCFMWTDQHPPNEVPTSEDLAPLNVALASVSPAPVPLVEAALSRLSDLQVGAASTSSDVASAKAEAARAVETTRLARTYSSFVVLKQAGNQVDIRWRVDFAAPDRYHVLQTAGGDIPEALKNGGMFSEWITIGRDNYLSAGIQWLKRSMGEAGLNESFRVDKFLHIMTAAEPISAAESVSQEDKYTVLDYRLASGFHFGFNTKGITEPTEARIWIDTRTNLIARGEITAIVAVEGKKSKLTLQQVFTGYGVPIRIEPPAM